MRPLSASRAVLALLLTAAAAGGCGAPHHEPAPAGAGPARNIRVLHPVTGVGGALILPARVSAREEITLTARIAARLTALPVREGGRFAAGRTLATFEAHESRAALESARAALEAATLARDLARRQESRMDSLHAQRVAALRETEGAQAERRAAEAAWAQARAQADAIESGMRLAAPFAGTVVRLHADVGATLGPGQPVMDLRSDAVGEIVVEVPESELPRLAGGRAEIQVGEGAWRPARIVRVDGMTDWTRRSRVARLLPEGGEPLVAGAFARVRLAPSGSAAAAGAALSVPSTSIVRRGALTGVYVAESGTARLRWLRIGREQGGLTEVLAGLSASDSVIADPTGLADGRLVTVTP